MPMKQKKPNGNGDSHRNPTSIIVHTQSSSPSLRITIPHEVIEMSGWDAGDVLTWATENDDGKYFIRLRRLE